MQHSLFLNCLKPEVVFLCVEECIFFSSWFFFLSSPSTPFVVFQSIHVVSASQWPWRQPRHVKGGRAVVVIPPLSCYRHSVYSGTANHQQSFAFKLCLFILLNDRPKSCLEMLNNCCNYPGFLKSFFICVTLPTDAIRFSMKQHRHKWTVLVLLIYFSSDLLYHF